MLCISVEEIKISRSQTTWTRRAKKKLTNSVTKYKKIKATLTSQKDENWLLGKITIIERTCEDPSTMEEIITELYSSNWLIQL